ncbi:hypothetical protein Dimus_004790 [Dionaea muscipula]
MMFASFVALVKSTGAFIAVSRSASATPVPPSFLSRGVGWQVDYELSLQLDELIILSGKFGAIFASIPPPIVAALNCLFFAYVGIFNDMISIPFSSPAFVGAIFAYLLDNTLHR